MLHIVFFARVKEQLGCASLDLDWDDSLATVEALRAALCARGGESWRETLYEENIIFAVNQTVVAAETPLGDNDEIAFFPPVTGG
jgi:molybdopterin synthase sulfur carrier subunit